MTTPEANEPREIRPEEHQRILTERDTLREEATARDARVAELELTVKDLGLRDRAFAHLSEQNVPDAMKYAELAVPRLRDLENLDEIPGVVDTIIPSSVMTPAPEPEPGEPTAEPQELPAIAGQPNPAAPGNQPNFTKLKMSDPEVQEVMAREGIAGVRKLHESGRLEFNEPLGQAEARSI